MNARTLTFPVVVLCALVGGLLFAAGPVLAANGHALTSSFGSETSTVPDTEPLSKPTGIAWSAKTGEVYVIDAGSNRVERFSSTGAPEGEFESPAGGFAAPNAIAVDNDPGSASYGDIYVSDAGAHAISKFEPEGKYTGHQLTEATTGVSLEELRGVAVDPAGSLDPSGTLWVFDNGGGGVYKFDEASSNVFTTHEHEEEEFGTEAAGIAIDSKENLYLIDSFFSQKALKFEPGTPSRAFAGLTECSCDTGVAVDPVTNNVYVDQGTSVAKYAPFAEPFEEPIEPPFGSGALVEGSGIAVSSAHTVYVADTKAGEVDVFSEGPKSVPAAEKAGVVEGTSAGLEGNLDGAESRYHFAYNTGSTCKGGKATPTVQTTVSENVSVLVTGLVAQTQYAFCLVTENAYGTEFGAPVTFTTTPSVPVIEKTSSSVDRIEAGLEGIVNPEREAASCVFQYGTSLAYGQETPCAPLALGEEGAGVPVTATLEGLVPDTTYDYRILASNGTGTQTGPNETFTTEVIPPTQVETAPATSVTPTTATLGGEANPGGSATYYVEYGSPTCSINGVPNFAWWLCASKSPEAGPLRGDSVQTVAPIEVTGLTPGTTYRYWIVAHNANGSERGEEATFTTPAAAAPLVPSLTTTTPAPAVVPAPKPPAVKPPPKRTKTAAQEKAEKLGRALKQCRKLKSKAKRKTCEAQVHKRYGPKTKSKPKSSKRGK
jgi:sugar lactone lactonase YvrE